MADLLIGYMSGSTSFIRSWWKVLKLWELWDLWELRELCELWEVWEPGSCGSCENSGRYRAAGGTGAMGGSGAAGGTARNVAYRCIQIASRRKKSSNHQWPTPKYLYVPAHPPLGNGTCNKTVSPGFKNVTSGVWCFPITSLQNGKQWLCSIRLGKLTRKPGTPQGGLVNMDREMDKYRHLYEGIWTSEFHYETSQFHYILTLGFPQNHSKAHNG